MEENFIDLLFKKSGVNREKYSNKKKEIDAFLKEKFNSFLKDNRIKINENLIKSFIKDQLEYLEIKPGHAARITRNIYKIYLEVLFKKYYPNIPLNLKEHILDNSYTHRLTLKRLKQLKLFLGDKKSESVKTLSSENFKDLRDKSIKFLIDNWDNPEFHPFYNVMEAKDKLIAVKKKYNIFIKIMRLSSSQSFNITFTYWLHPKYTNNSIEIYGRHIGHKRVIVTDDIQLVSESIVKKHQLNSFNDIKKEDDYVSPYSILTGFK